MKKYIYAITQGLEKYANMSKVKLITVVNSSKNKGIYRKIRITNYY